MLNAFSHSDGILQALPGDANIATLREALWIDLADPTDSERMNLDALYPPGLPSVDDVEEIEASARFYEDEHGLNVHSLFLHDNNKRPVATTVAFIINDGQLITLHEHNLGVFRLLRLRARREPSLAQDAISLLLGLFETKVENLADRLEEVHTDLERVSAMVLAESGVDMEDAFDELTRQEDISGRIRLCLMDSQRALTYLLRRGHLEAEQREWVREILRDVDSLVPHNTFLFEKVNFLMDAAMGFINIRQSQIIKIFSIAAVVFLPPTVVASIFGMNFRIMPLLETGWGYPIALVIMLLSGIAPYLYFKSKGWLR